MTSVATAKPDIICALTSEIRQDQLDLDRVKKEIMAALAERRVSRSIRSLAMRVGRGKLGKVPAAVLEREKRCQSKNIRGLQRENNELKRKLTSLEEKKVESPAKVATVQTPDKSSSEAAKHNHKNTMGKLT